MCTLTWRPSREGYELFFNRDERITRLPALPPQLFCHNNGEDFSLYPVDGNAGGTWIATNSHRLSFALINNYQAEALHMVPNAQSRGDIIVRLATAKSLEQVQQKMNQMSAEHYNPYQLFVFSPGTRIRYSWDGQRFDHRTFSMSTAGCAFSSGFDQAGVHASRLALFEALPNSADAYLNFHRAHQPQRGAYSVCMHRNDAKTVSFTHVRVDRTGARMRYTDGSPCDSLLGNWLEAGNTGMTTPHPQQANP